MGVEADFTARDPGRLVECAKDVDVLGTDILQSRYSDSNARGGTEVQFGGQGDDYGILLITLIIQPINLQIWKDLMKQVQADTQVMVVIEIDKMSERLKKAYSLLVAIQKGLNAVSFCSLDS